MRITYGEEGLNRSWQNDFPKITECCHCGGNSRIGFVAHEAIEPDDFSDQRLCFLHENKGKGEYWLHDVCSVAVYFCKDCLNPTALYNQA